MEHPSRTPFPGGQALAWALLSQSIWLPLLAIDLHDRWQSALREQRRIAEAAAALQGGRGRVRSPAVARAGADPQAAGEPSTGLLLGAAATHATAALEEARRLIDRQRDGLLGSTGREDHAASQPAPEPRGGAGQPSGSRPSFRPASLPAQPSATARLSAVASPLSGRVGADPFTQGFNRAELLGGSIGLGDLNGPLVHPLAMAERARWAASGDPLAPLPGQWREPMRRALQELRTPGRPQARVTTARIVHVPSTRVSRPTTVPLAVQADGSVDILSTPDDPRVVDEIRQWSARQAPERSGGVTAAVVKLEPLSAEPDVIRPPASLTANPAHQGSVSSGGERLSSVRPAPAAPQAAPEPQPAAAPVAAAPAVHPVAPPPPVPAAPVAAPAAQEVSAAAATPASAATP